MTCCGGGSGHGSSLMGDLLDDGLHELWGEAGNVDRCGTRLAGARRVLLSRDLRPAARISVNVHLHHDNGLHGLMGDTDHAGGSLPLTRLLIGSIRLCRRSLILLVGSLRGLGLAFGRLPPIGCHGHRGPKVYWYGDVGHTTLHDHRGGVVGHGPNHMEMTGRGSGQVAPYVAEGD